MLRGNSARYLAAVPIFCSATTGCVTPAVIPPESTLEQVRTIVVIPIETGPLLLHPSTEEERTAMGAIGLIPSSTKGGGFHYVPVPVILCPLCPLLQVPVALAAFFSGPASSSDPKKSETIVITQDAFSPWMPTVGLAYVAAEELRRSGRQVTLISGYGRLPVTDRSVTLSGENWMAPLRRWYNASETQLDFGAQGAPQADALLEVGVSNYEYVFERLILQIMVKLSDPRTKKVFGQTRCYESPNGRPLPEMLAKQGALFRGLIESTGTKLLVQCLRELRLYH
jgi:hypothetical protein